MKPEPREATARPWRIKEYAPSRWHVIGPSGIPVYDDAPYGKDKPLVFRDDDLAMAYVDRCNEEREQL